MTAAWPVHTEPNSLSVFIPSSWAVIIRSTSVPPGSKWLSALFTSIVRSSSPKSSLPKQSYRQEMSQNKAHCTNNQFESDSIKYKIIKELGDWGSMTCMTPKLKKNKTSCEYSKQGFSYPSYLKSHNRFIELKEWVIGTVWRMSESHFTNR